MRVLFCSLDARGFIYPQIGVALELVRSGHEVAFATNLAASDELARLGLPRIARSEPDGESFHIQLWGHPLSIAIQSEHVGRAVREFRPDVIVTSELAIGAVLAARRFALPVVVLGLATLPWPVTDDLSPNATSARARRARWRRGELDKMIAAIPGVGLEAIGLGSPLEVATVYLLQSSPEMVRQAGIVLPPHVRLVGDCGWEPDWPDNELDVWLEAERPASVPLVYGQQGSTFGRPQFWESLVAAASVGDFAICGSYARAKEISDARTPHAFGRRHVPQRRVLRVADAVVSSAASTAVLGALVTDLPLVLVPAGGEQEDLAEICRHFDGVSVISPEDATSARLTDALGSVRERSGRSWLADELRAAGGARAAAAAIAAVHARPVALAGGAS